MYQRKTINYRLHGQMDLRERLVIETGLYQGESFKKMAKRLDRNPSTISHEVLTNRTNISDSFYAGKDSSKVRQCVVTGLCGADEYACSCRCKYCKGL